MLCGSWQLLTLVHQQNIAITCYQAPMGSITDTCISYNLDTTVNHIHGIIIVTVHLSLWSKQTYKEIKQFDHFDYPHHPGAVVAGCTSPGDL